MSKYNLILIDRDGVINKKAPPHKYIVSWKEFEFLPKSKEAMAILAKTNYKIALVTNQRGIARGIMTSEDLYSIHEKMITKIIIATDVILRRINDLYIIKLYID